MVPTKYNRRPPSVNVKIWVDGELRNVEISISTIIDLLKAVDVPIQLGPNDSGGVGFKVLRIPN